MAESIKPNGAIFEPMMEDDDAEKPIPQVPGNRKQPVRIRRGRPGRRGSRPVGDVHGGSKK